MKTLITLFVLFFSSSVVADDIFDYEIDGISIGDSLLDYFSYDEIINSDKNEYPGSNKFYDLYITSNENSLFEIYHITVKLNDKNFIVHSISGEIDFNYQIEKCFEHKNYVLNEIKDAIPNVKSREYEWQYTELADGKSIAYITGIELSSGKIRVYCVNTSDASKNSLNFPDYFSIEMSTNEILNWLTNEANTG